MTTPTYIGDIAAKRAAKRPVTDVSEIIESQQLTFFIARLVVLCALASFFDGFDMNAISLVAPEMSATLHLNRLMMGNVFSAGLAGMVFGGFLFGYLGDRIGRRPSIILATVSFGVLTLWLALAANYTEIMVLRFFQGIGIGGLFPLTWVLNTDYVPRRFQATVVTLVTVGHTFGDSFAGPMSIWLTPTGWRSVFAFGGCGALAVSGLLFFLLPESIKFLVNRGKRADLIAKFARLLAPNRTIYESDCFVASERSDPHGQGFRVSALFRDELLWITPLLWTAYIVSSIALFLRFSWGPTILQAMGFSRSASAYATSINSLAGAIGGFLLMRFTDTRGAISIAVCAVLSAPLLLAMGLSQISGMAFLWLYFFSTMFLVGAHFGLLSIAAIFYPSAYRSNGAGWVSSIGKIGSVIGPLVGGVLLSSRIPVRRSFALLAICAVVVALSVFQLGLTQSRLLWGAGARGGPVAPG